MGLGLRPRRGAEECDEGCECSGGELDGGSDDGWCSGLAGVFVFEVVDDALRGAFSCAEEQVLDIEFTIDGGVDDVGLGVGQLHDCLRGKSVGLHDTRLSPRRNLTGEVWNLKMF